MNLRDQTRANTQIYVKNRKEKITEKERAFQYNSEKITMVIAWSHTLGFLGLIDCPPLVGGCLVFIQVGILG